MYAYVKLPEIQIAVFWFITLCSLRRRYWRFGGIRCLHFQCWKPQCEQFPSWKCQDFTKSFTWEQFLIGLKRIWRNCWLKFTVQTSFIPKVRFWLAKLYGSVWGADWHASMYVYDISSSNDHHVGVIRGNGYCNSRCSSSVIRFQPNFFWCVSLANGLLVAWNLVLAHTSVSPIPVLEVLTPASHFDLSVIEYETNRHLHAVLWRQHERCFRLVQISRVEMVKGNILCDSFQLCLFLSRSGEVASRP